MDSMIRRMISRWKIDGGENLFFPEIRIGRMEGLFEVVLF